jgi:ArsR family transcriptional regulator, arsenate/arsenite/antimonite-responsive transcriptional repressor
MKDAARLFKILADETRLKMLWLLFNHRELCVCDVLEALAITQSKASRHLTAMRHAGLVSDRKAGLWTYYALRPVEDELVRQQLDVLRTMLARREEAAPLLASLHQWLRAKSRDAECASGSACAVAMKKRPASRARRAQMKVAR